MLLVVYYTKPKPTSLVTLQITASIFVVLLVVVVSNSLPLFTLAGRALVFPLSLDKDETLFLHK